LRYFLAIETTRRRFACELDLLRGGQEIDLADVLQEELQRVGRDLARLFDSFLLLLDAGDDLDVELLERVVKVVDLPRLEVELVERDGDLVGTELPVFLPCVEQRLCIVRLEQVDDGLRWCDGLGCAHSVPPSWNRRLAMPHCASWPG